MALLKEKLVAWFLKANKEYNKNVKEKERIYNRKWEKRKRMKWKEEHREEIKERKELKKKLGKERKKVRQIRYISKKKGALGNHTLEEWEDKKKEFNYCCAICGKKEPFEDQYFKKLTEDHIIPLSKGGSNYIENIQPACHKCNCLKRAKI